MHVRVGRGRGGGKPARAESSAWAGTWGTDAWGWSGYLLHEELSGLDSEMKDNGNVGGTEGLACRNKITCLPAFFVFRKIHRQPMYRDCVTDSPVRFYLCQSLTLRSSPFLFQPLGIEGDGSHPPLLVCAAPPRSRVLSGGGDAVPGDAAPSP